MTFLEWLSLFAVSLLGAASPGPSLAVVVRNTLNHGKMSGLLTSWSHATGIIIYAVLTLFGLGVLLKENLTLFTIISYSGALYLAWLGYKAFTSKGGTFGTTEEKRKTSYKQSLRDGFFISMLNPKIGLFFLALFSQYMKPDMGFDGKFITVLTPFLTDGLWYTFITTLISYKKILEFLRRKALWIDKITGVVLILIALKILFV